MFAWTGLQVEVANLGWLVIHQLVESNIQKLNFFGTSFTFKKRKENLLSRVRVLYKKTISSVYVVVLQRTANKCTKMYDAREKLLFC